MCSPKLPLVNLCGSERKHAEAGCSGLEPRLVDVVVVLVPPLRDQVQHLIGAEDAVDVLLVVDAASSNLVDDVIDLRPGHAIAHADIVQHVLDAFGGDCLDVQLAAVHCSRLDDVLLEAFRVLLRVAVGK